MSNLSRRGFLGSMAALGAAIGARSLVGPRDEQRLQDREGSSPTTLPATGTVAVYINGLLQQEGMDYHIENDRMRFETPPRADDWFVCLFEGEGDVLRLEHRPYGEMRES